MTTPDPHATRVAEPRLDGIEIRPVTDDEVPAFGVAIGAGFGEEMDDGWADRFRAHMPLDRTLAAFDGPDIVGTFGEYPLVVTVPGGNRIDLAGTTIVTVRSTHRRRGLLRAMMVRHLATVAKRGDLIAGLWASEAPIYGRFGYGLASHSFAVDIDARRVQVPQLDPDLRIDHLAGDQLTEIVGPFWDSLGGTRVGLLDRSEARWNDIAADPEAHRGGATARRHVVVREGGAVVGYACYRQRSVWDGPIANGKVEVEVLVSAHVAAHAALWHHLTTIDLFPNVSFWNLPVDDPVIVLASDMRQVRRTMNDAGYIRIMDLPGAIDARTYETDGRLTLAVVDDLGYCGGTFTLVVDGGTATVAETDAEPDLTCDIEALGALYLGGSSAPMLAAAGKITGTPEHVATLDRIFRTTDAPWVPEEF